MPRPRHLALTGFAEKCGAVGLDRGSDRALAFRARLIGAAIDLELMLEIAELAIGLHIVPKG